MITKRLVLLLLIIILLPSFTFGLKKNKRKDIIVTVESQKNKSFNERIKKVLIYFYLENAKEFNDYIVSSNQLLKTMKNNKNIPVTTVPVSTNHLRIAESLSKEFESKKINAISLEKSDGTYFLEETINEQIKKYKTKFFISIKEEPINIKTSGSKTINLYHYKFDLLKIENNNKLVIWEADVSVEYKTKKTMGKNIITSEIPDNIINELTLEISNTMFSELIGILTED